MSNYYGYAISTNGERPDWLARHETIHWSNNGGPYQPVTAGEVRQWGDADNSVSIRLRSGHPRYEITSPMTDLSPETVGKLVALVRRMALADKAEFVAMGTGCREAYAEADAIVAELPEPVDPDLAEARAMAASFSDRNDVSHADFMNGDMDSGDEVQQLLAAIKRGRALAGGDRHADC